MSLCRRLVAADPDKRFPDAADLGRKGAAAFHHQLVKGDLASEYGNNIRVWLAFLAARSVLPRQPISLYIMLPRRRAYRVLEVVANVRG